MSELAAEFEPSDQTIRTWIKQADIDGGSRSDGATTAEREELRQEIFRRISPLELSAAGDEAKEIMRPKGMRYFDFLDRRFTYVRQFAPEFLEVMPLQANRGGAAVMKGIEVLRRVNSERKRKLPAGTPTNFVPKRWEPSWSTRQTTMAIRLY